MVFTILIAHEEKELNNHIPSSLNLPMGTNGVSLNFLNSFDVWLVSVSYSVKTDSWPDDMVAAKTKSLSSGFRNTKFRELLEKENPLYIPPITNVHVVRYKRES